MGENVIDLNDLRTVEQLAAEHPGVLKVATLRHQLRNRDENGLDSCCVRLGHRLLISKTRYQRWLGSRGARSATAPAVDLV